jgi:small subunit ribosomal protein S10
MAEQKVRIKVKGFDHKLVDQAVRQIVEAVESTGGIVAGPVPLPTHIEKFCVIRSPNIDKDSREQFEIRTHKRLIDILQPGSKTIDALTGLNLASGVEIDIKLQESSQKPRGR